MGSPAQRWFSSRSKKTSGQQNLTIELCKALPVPLPALYEQSKIAQIPPTWDKAIENTEKLIENSKMQKKALMQQLLTGKKRFPGFVREWVPRLIAQFGKVITGNTPSRYEPDNYGTAISWATAVDFSSKYVGDTQVKLSKTGAKNARIVPCGSVLVTCIASIGKNGIAKEDLATNQQINAVVVNPDHSNEFLYYLVEYYKQKLHKLAGIAVVPILNKKTFEKISFNVPFSLKEQNKIAELLAHTDVEIECLRKQHHYFQQEKKALMQELLTGKRRVKVGPRLCGDDGSEIVA